MIATQTQVRPMTRESPGLALTVAEADAKVQTMTSSPATDQFRAARDLLLELRSDYAAAREQFTAPRPEHFNWALDWFDQVAAVEPARSRPALRVVEADGSEVSMTYGELADRS